MIKNCNTIGLWPLFLELIFDQKRPSEKRGRPCPPSPLYPFLMCHELLFKFLCDFSPLCIYDLWAWHPTPQISYFSKKMTWNINVDAIFVEKNIIDELFLFLNIHFSLTKSTMSSLSRDNVGQNILRQVHFCIF